MFWIAFFNIHASCLWQIWTIINSHIMDKIMNQKGQRQNLPHLHNKESNRIDENTIKSSNFQLHLLRISQKMFVPPPRLELILQKSWQTKQEILVLKFEIQLEKTFSFRIEVSHTSQTFLMQIDESRRTIRVLFNLGYIFLRQSNKDWEKEEHLKDGNLLISFDIKDIDLVRRFLKNNFKSQSYKFLERFRHQEKNNEAVSAFHNVIKNQCLAHKQEILFDVLKIEKVEAKVQQLMRCPVSPCNQTFTSALLLRQHLLTDHPYLQKYGISLRNDQEKKGFQFSEELLNYVLVLSQFFPEQIKQIIKKIKRQ